jgi:aspartate carbamoyltransferase catalytic subunit
LTRSASPRRGQYGYHHARMPASAQPRAAPAPPLTWDRQHLLQLEGLSAADLTVILDQAEQMREAASGRAPRLDLLAQRTVANLFFEDSTRTRSSFTLAARRLGADTLDITIAGSSVRKGETVVDTALNLQAMGVHAFVVRSSAAGGPGMIARAVHVPVINAGDGSHEHPTQGLLDLLTMRQRLKVIEGRTIGIVGDIANSRVARSNIHALTTMGANVICIGPPTLAPRTFEKIADANSPGRVRVHHDLDDVLGDLDAIMMLRVQFERAAGAAGVAAPLPHASIHTTQVSSPSLISGDYRELYGLNAARAARLRPHAVIMHPGPINRGLELDSDVADDPKRSVILQQVANGVAVRMAVLAMLAGRER